jgi:hypothetical protein
VTSVHSSLSSATLFRFGIAYLSNERHLESDETEMKRWKIFHIEHLLATQCQMTGHRVRKETRKVWGAKSIGDSCDMEEGSHIH